MVKSLNLLIFYFLIKFLNFKLSGKPLKGFRKTMTLSKLHFYTGHCVDNEGGWGETAGIKKNGKKQTNSKWPEEK